MLPQGFTDHPSGLVVPIEHRRARQVLTRDELKLIDRTAKVLAQVSVAHQMKCGKTDCPDPVLRRLPSLDGSTVLQCGCTDRVFTRLR